MITPGKEHEFVLRAAHLPEEVTKLLELHADDLRILDLRDVEFRERLNRKSHLNDIKTEDEQSENVKINLDTTKRLTDLYHKIKEEFEKTKRKTWVGACDNIWSFGPRRNGCNILINRDNDYRRPSVWSALLGECPNDKEYRELDQSIVSGFQLATLAGPLCEEPMQGVALIVEEWNRGEEEISNELTGLKESFK